MRNVLIAAVATAAIAFAGLTGATAQTSSNNNMNMNMGGTTSGIPNAQQPQQMQVQKRRHVAHKRVRHHKMSRNAPSHRLAKRSTHRLGLAKRTSKSHLGLASSKVQPPKQQQAKKRMPNRETTGTGSAGSMQNTNPQNTNPSSNNNSMQR
jgi:hypothetical protein